MTREAPRDDPERCPFCGDSVPSPGKGIMIHINETPHCDAQFEAWKDRLGGDLPGGWDT